MAALNTINRDLLTYAKQPLTGARKVIAGAKMCHYLFYMHNRLIVRAAS